MVRLNFFPSGHDVFRVLADASHGAGSGGQPFSTFKYIQDIMYVTVPHTMPHLNGC